MSKILLADESPFVVRFFSQLLPSKRPDLEVVTARTTDEVFDILGDDEIALLVLDTSFGSASTQTVLTKLTAVRPGLPVVLTSDEPMESADFGQVTGLIDVLAQPFSSDRFVRLIHHALPPSPMPKKAANPRDRDPTIRRELSELLVGLQAVKRSLAAEVLPEEAVCRIIDEQVSPLIVIASELSLEMRRRSNSGRMGR
jgi:DNA-binding NtrC family response regulator